ncbi:MAG: phage tailspike protein [Cetobacterium sp.]|uniref:phage tailspike protein n=1 Tax=Cetobacterium sp. TaxID=2071632 RepID=UPI003F381F01
MTVSIVPNIVVGMPSQPFIQSSKFSPVFNGYIYLGKIDTDPLVQANRVSVYIDNEDGTYTEVEQPLKTNAAGFIVYNGKVGKVVLVDGYSMLVQDSNRAQVYYYPNVLGYNPDQFELRAKDIYWPIPYKKDSNITFSSGGVLSSQYDLIKEQSTGLFYKWSGALPKTVPPSSSPSDPLFKCVGAINGFPLNDSRSFLITGSGDETAKVKAWLSSGEKNLYGDQSGVITVSSEIEIPEGVSVRASIKFSGSGNNIVLVNSNSEFYGCVSGTGSTNKVERAFYPAKDGVSNVHIDAEISDVTFGVHAQPLTSGAAMPSGWTGEIRAKKIVGAVGKSEGYAALLSPASDFNMRVIADDVARHVAYLSAGARSNKIEARVKKCGNVAVQYYSTIGQPATQDNVVDVWLDEIYNPSGQTGQAIGVVALGNVSGNETNIRRAVGGDAVVKVEGDVQNGLIPNGNVFNLFDIRGTYSLGDVCQSIDSRGTKFNVGMWFAKAGFSGIAFRKTTSTESAEFISGEVSGLNMSMAGSGNVGIYGDQGLTVRLGRINISNNGSAPRVNVDESKRIGYTREFTGSYSILVGAASQASQDITLPFAPKKVNTQVVNFSVANTGAVSWIDGALSASLNKKLWAYNPAASQTVGVQVTIEGD